MDFLTKLVTLLTAIVKLFSPSKKKKSSINAAELAKEQAEHEEEITKLHAEEIANRESIANITSMHDRLEAIRQRVNSRKD